MIVGDSLPDLKKQSWYKEHLFELVDSLAALALQRKVFFSGRQAPTAMPGFYQSAAITLIPTRSGEGTSLAALESMACGTPVISTRVEGLLDLPTIKSDPDPECLATTMREVYTTGVELGRQQRLAVTEHFGLDRWASAWQQVLHSLH